MGMLREFFNKRNFGSGEIKKKKWIPIFVIAGLLGILLIGFSSCEGQVSKAGSSDSSQRLSAEEYTDLLEKKLESTLSKIGGAGKVEVMITLEQGTEYVYATEQKDSGDATASSGSGGTASGEKQTEEKTFFTVDTGNGEQALVVTERSPKIKGVVVVCSGTANAAVFTSVRTAVTTSLGIDESNVCVVMHS